MDFDYFDMESWADHISAADFRISQRVYESSSLSCTTLHLIGLTGEGWLWLLLPIPLCLFYLSLQYPASYDHLWSNLYLVNLIDVVMIVLAKHLFQRQRPNYQATNKTAVFVGPDKHSFPSGHTSRAWSIFFIVMTHPECKWSTRCLTMMWAVSVSASRVFLGRHYVGDLCGGFCLALINAMLYRKTGGVTTILQLIPAHPQFVLSGMLTSGVPGL
eukprot:TRINITY_DN1072_c1_g2_i4.p1 TRINITY_DN1072_c1_g2~~TRINITY_DN1072_c1_g2_i4.p1  ORF type:complete len:216 (+),score=46.87 TRINITY_DN1072_c1_g2_i4:47-694(+)